METISKTRIKPVMYRNEIDALTYSNIAELKGIDNRTITHLVYDNLLDLIRFVYIPLKVITMTDDIVISSGYRCWELNEIVGGVKNSQHLYGQAMDFYCKEKGNLERAWETLQKMNVDQAIRYKEFIHVSFVSFKNNRNQYIDKRLTK